MSGVHVDIVTEALNALSAADRGIFEPYREELQKTSSYLDVFADRSMSARRRHAIDPEADRYLPRTPPRNAHQRKILRLAEAEEVLGVATLRFMYDAEYYLREAVKSLTAGDVRSAAKFCGTASHIAGDTAEPVHAVSPRVLDHVVPPPPRHIGFELHGGLEGLKAPVDIRGYRPRRMGATLSAAVMGMYAGLVEARRVGAAQAVPMTQAIYAGRRSRARALSSRAQNQAARWTADLMHTVCRLARGSTASQPGTLDLRRYPWADCRVDMLYRYQPMRDLSLIPYSGGQTHPLALASGGDGGTERVRGLGVVPYLGPPYVKTHLRETTVEYYLCPGAFARFRARVGGNPLFRDTICRGMFRVLTDGREQFRSPVLGHRDRPVEVDVPLGKARWLVLAMSYQPASNPTLADIKRLRIGYALHGVWAEPRLTD